eukprot:CAMPEP_0178982870 /NCGR_PEP_ID=MMETSP0795-20121207/736_1 /TAXON_ID=88552 /ORGANISM="Amoebophrya sp., Strain Ameob2" /LENGTH=651 /DNA_ID=CAMNT_0020673563 /DNA_START=192 /DNA_END=2149 /DNA_ORIENTATION=-
MRASIRATSASKSSSFPSSTNFTEAGNQDAESTGESPPNPAATSDETATKPDTDDPGSGLTQRRSQNDSKALSRDEVAGVDTTARDHENDIVPPELNPANDRPEDALPELAGEERSMSKLSIMQGPARWQSSRPGPPQQQAPHIEGAEQEATEAGEDAGNISTDPAAAGAGAEPGTDEGQGMADSTDLDSDSAGGAQKENDETVQNGAVPLAPVRPEEDVKPPPPVDQEREEFLAAKKEKLARAKKFEDAFRRPDGSLRTDAEQVVFLAQKLASECEAEDVQMKCDCDNSGNQRLLTRCHAATQTTADGKTHEGQSPWVECDMKESKLLRAKSIADPGEAGSFVCVLKKNAKNGLEGKTLQMPYAKGREGSQKIIDLCLSTDYSKVSPSAAAFGMSTVGDSCRRKQDAFPQVVNETQEVRGWHGTSVSEPNVVYRNLQAEKLGVVNCLLPDLQVRCRCLEHYNAPLSRMPFEEDAESQVAQALDVRCRNRVTLGPGEHSPSDFFPCLPVLGVASGVDKAEGLQGVPVEPNSSPEHPEAVFSTLRLRPEVHAKCLMPFGQKCMKPPNGVGVDLSTCRTMVKVVEFPRTTKGLRELQIADYCDAKCRGRTYNKRITERILKEMGAESEKNPVEINGFDPKKQIEGWGKTKEFL